MNDEDVQELTLILNIRSPEFSISRNSVKEDKSEQTDDLMNLLGQIDIVTDFISGLAVDKKGGRKLEKVVDKCLIAFDANEKRLQNEQLEIEDLQTQTRNILNKLNVEKVA